ncbi:hypothetical protein CYMTET_19646 [Cymbomonas tetramitiformis]|uniref:Uncharacterized protein n=1 Tax=Cymbomonas tetramitiformis TaxID=36881 RepID=A0AAE0G5L2_9CHLO|nr:hypothetical protein CYMTET_19646 [Cymbomonas tetramitiformis]
MPTITVRLFKRILSVKPSIFISSAFFVCFLTTTFQYRPYKKTLYQDLRETDSEYTIPTKAEGLPNVAIENLQSIPGIGNQSEVVFRSHSEESSAISGDDAVSLDDIDILGVKGEYVEYEKQDVHSQYSCTPQIQGPRRRPEINADILTSLRSANLTNVFVTQENHKRLMSDTLTLKKSIIPLLPANATTIKNSFPLESCAVVGNSGSLTFGKFGQSVDSHDIVIRINQAPTSRQHKGRVGTRTTFRLLNHLWTAHYAYRAEEKNVPVEPNVTLVVSRAESSRPSEYLYKSLLRQRADVHLLYLSSRLVTTVRHMLVDYRKRLCSQGYGPYAGGSTPSSGLLAVYIARRICKHTALYGFSNKVLRHGVFRAQAKQARLLSLSPGVLRHGVFRAQAKQARLLSLSPGRRVSSVAFSRCSPRMQLRSLDRPTAAAQVLGHVERRCAPWTAQLQLPRCLDTWSGDARLGPPNCSCPGAWTRGAAMRALDRPTAAAQVLGHVSGGGAFDRLTVSSAQPASHILERYARLIHERELRCWSDELAMALGPNCSCLGAWIRGAAMALDRLTRGCPAGQLDTWCGDVRLGPPKCSCPGAWTRGAAMRALDRPTAAAQSTASWTVRNSEDEDEDQFDNTKPPDSPEVRTIDGLNGYYPTKTIPLAVPYHYFAGRGARFGPNKVGNASAAAFWNNHMCGYNPLQALPTMPHTEMRALIENPQLSRFFVQKYDEHEKRRAALMTELMLEM